MELKSYSRKAVLETIMHDDRLRVLFDVVSRSTNLDHAHDVEHALRVAFWTAKIINSLDADGARELQYLGMAAAMLHDLENYPKNHRNRKYSSSESAVAAQMHLAAAGFADVDSDVITDAIRAHSFTSGEVATSLIARALQDADRLNALGAVGIFRCVSVSTKMGSFFFNAEDPWACHRLRDDIKFTVDHFQERLLRIPDIMNTDVGKVEAQIRVAVMHQFLFELGRELGDEFPGTPPPGIRS